MSKNAKIWLEALLAVLMLAGCQHAALTTGGYSGQGLKVNHQGVLPGYVARTYVDGTVDVRPLDAVPIATTCPVAVVTIVPPRVLTSTYEVTPEKQTGDTYVGVRAVSWATQSPNVTADNIATKREKRETRSLPAVAIDTTGIHAAAGGGSTSSDNGISWWTRVKQWWGALWSGFTMSIFWIVVIGLLVIFVLPLFIPALAPIMAALWKAILTFIGWLWDIVERIITWFEEKMAKRPAPPVVATTSTTSTTSTTTTPPLAVPVPAAAPAAPVAVTSTVTTTTTPPLVAAVNETISKEQAGAIATQAAEQAVQQVG